LGKRPKKQEDLMTARDPNKAKIARRVIEVLEFFDEHQGQATVMDIARRYKRPQSSTSELLAILVEMGLLYKDPETRTFAPTPRAAMLGSLSQPDVVRDGRLAMLTERLTAQTCLGTAIMGMIGPDTQIFRWLGGASPIAGPMGHSLSGGLRDRLSDNAAGWLLLSTIPAWRRAGLIHRLRAEAPSDRKFSHAWLNERAQACERRGYAVGPAGFRTSAQMCAVLVPTNDNERPLALGLVYEADDRVDPDALVAFLQRSVETCVKYQMPGVKPMTVASNAG
jgi:DNA-binding IclR family transcriptional regulator